MLRDPPCSTQRFLPLNPLRSLISNQGFCASLRKTSLPPSSFFPHQRHPHLHTHHCFHLLADRSPTLMFAHI
ncbi:hypothetical protein KP509_27G023700 [Ceratopteris richardii]|uniref:Uncharacterized protein n=1 Tax=Ceratopteris richardii TaxID=49495 RepID=A0A8T2RH47_CERRI|nr:hypothetical protein KP509_27G023700 [Ceratopteris richardii]